MPQLDILELAGDDAATKRARRFRYLCGVRLPSGSLHVSDVSTEMSPESFVAGWYTFLQKFQNECVKGRRTEDDSYIEKVNYLKEDALLNKRRFGQQAQFYKSPSRLQNLEIQVAVKRKRPFVPVRIISFSDQKAYCKAGFEGFWLGVELDRSDLEKLDLHVGDSFEWVPRDDGKVFEDDMRSHPRRPNPGEYERAEKAFSELVKLRQELKG